MKRTSLWFLVALVAFSVLSCKKTLTEDTVTTEQGSKAAPDGFDYSTTRKVDVTVRLLTVKDEPLNGVLVSFYNPDNVSAGAEISKVLSDNNGYVKTTLVVPSYLENVIIDPAYVGLIRNAKAVIASDNTISLVIGGKNGYSGNLIVENATSSVASKQAGLTSATDNTVYDYNKASFDALGRPLNLEPIDNIDFSNLLKEINASLPERKNGVLVHPEYLSTSVPTNLNIVKPSDVWITFVSEGADYRNTLGYYTYPTNTPPQKASDIKNVHIILPNASLKGARGEGNMMMGDKVYIGTFDANTSVGFVLISNAYNSDGSISYNNLKYYSNEELNPEPITNDVTIRRHNVLLHNLTDKTFLIGFEDIKRDLSSCDNDFNDLVFYAQANPRDGISGEKVPYLEEKVEDTDHDGVPDVIDEYPTDPLRAYNRYYPSETIWGTLAFEDQWPSEGDYDLNDLVVSYRYKFVINGSNKVVDVVSELKPVAAGASFQNGFGIQFPFQPSVVGSSAGQKLSAGSYVSLASNGVEAGQSQAVIIPFDTYRTVFNSSSSYINTNANAAKINSDTVRVKLTFNSPQSDSFTSGVPFNPFMISNMERGREVHLVGANPTSLGNVNLAADGKYKINVAAGKYYITTENKPFALNFVTDFKYPLEKINIAEGYVHFSEWAASGGNLYKDWYLEKTGYRKTEKLYTK